MSSIVSLHRYPVKGLSGDLLPEINLTVGKGVPYDRKYAIALGDTEFDPANPEHLSKRKFLMLMGNVNLAELKTSFNAAEGVLTIKKEGQTVYEGKLDDAGDAKALGAFFDEFMNGKTRGGARLVSASGHMFADIPEQNVSIINVNSVKAFQADSEIGDVDQNRFRGNIYVDLPAWSEFDLVGKKFRLGGAVLQGAGRTERCAAVNVNLDTAKRDMNIPLTLKKTYGHSDMGIYADVVEAGVIKPGDRLELL